ncbi:hypothetical protein A0J61_10052 [Choanephora cucurbitarum]|uniref:Helitron helicase-like domain-containing protein n=1 Tax=Choanephora cucurbitarum TaxID=101091 RepID=A0A1C7MYP9_9FUNG|nr:hypothetical protein A0J61_10052 [Choanephora cucurbitarum]
MYAKIVQFRLNFIRNDQSSLRWELYRGLQDAVAHDDANANSLGLKVILPSIFIGGPRHMAQLYRDSMSIPEITNELLFGQSASDTPDLCSRVFRLKSKELMKDLTKNHISGKVIGHVSVIEFRKRELPHAHVLIIVRLENNLRNEDNYDKVVSAEIPDPNRFLLAHATVSKNMMHGTCGSLDPRAVCMKDGRCSKGFPEKMVDAIVTVESGYPVYRRRRDDRGVMKRNGVLLDYFWVVPHNIYLCTKYDAHINVEVCSTVSAVKYIYKYVYKGYDRANVVISNSTQQKNSNNQNPVMHDEINHFVDARYVSANETAWRIFGFSLHKEFPRHQRLGIHLSGEQAVYFEEGSNLQEVLNSRAATINTTLTAWFDSNRVDPHGHQFLYTEFPEHYTWHKRECKWKQRHRGLCETIGRIYSVSSREPEKFYLRVLLNDVCGTTSFEDIRTVNGILYDTFQAAARVKGLLADDEQWDPCLLEGNTLISAKILTKLFAIILLFLSELTNKMINIAHGNSLLDIDDLLNVQNARITDFNGFELPTIDTRDHHTNEGQNTN